MRFMLVTRETICGESTITYAPTAKAALAEERLGLAVRLQGARPSSFVIARQLRRLYVAEDV